MQYGLRTAQTATKELAMAHPRGWAFLRENSDKDLYSVFFALFRNDQRGWNIAKKVLKQVDRDLRVVNRSIPYCSSKDEARARLERLWKYYTSVGVLTGLRLLSKD